MPRHARNRRLRQCVHKTASKIRKKEKTENRKARERGVIRSGQGAGIHPKKRSSLPDISCTFLQCTAFCGKWEAFPVHRATPGSEARRGTPQLTGEETEPVWGIFALAQIHPRMREPAIQQTLSDRKSRYHPIRCGVKLPLPNPRRDLEGTSFPPAAEPRRTGFR